MWRTGSFALANTDRFTRHTNTGCYGIFGDTILNS